MQRRVCSGTLLDLKNLKQSKMSGTYFLGDNSDYSSSNLLYLKDVKDARFYYNNFTYSNDNTLIAIDSKLTVKDEQYLYNGYLDNSPTLLTITNSTLEIHKGDTFNAGNVDNNNSTIINLKPKETVEKTYNWYFETLTDTSIVLIPIVNVNSSIDKLLVEDDNSTASYDILINNQTITKNLDTDKIKIFDLKDTNNRLNKGMSDRLALQVTGTANNITVQIELIEF